MSGTQRRPPPPPCHYSYSYSYSYSLNLNVHKMGHLYGKKIALMTLRLLSEYIMVIIK